MTIAVLKNDQDRGCRLDFDLTNEQEMIRKEVRAFAEKEIAPVAADLDEQEHFSAELTCKMGDIGLFGMFVAPFTNYWLIAASFALFGFAMGGLLLGLCGLFAIDIASRHASGAAIGFVGIFSYVAAALQENISGVLIDRSMIVIDGVNHYDFTVPIIFWISAAALSLLLGCTLWNAKTSE